MAVLSNPDIKKEIVAGRIQFDPPLEDRQFGEASVDLRIGFSFTKLNPISGRFSVAEGLAGLPDGAWTTVNLPETDEFGKRVPFTLDPGEFILAVTHEKITIPRHLIGFLEGRSTYARMGLSMHVTAPWIQPGWDNTPVILEIRNHGGLKIDLVPLIDRPCQLSFFRLSKPVPAKIAYGAKASDSYQGQSHPIKQAQKKAAKKVPMKPKKVTPSVAKKKRTTHKKS